LPNVFSLNVVLPNVLSLKLWNKDILWFKCSEFPSFIIKSKLTSVRPCLVYWQLWHSLRSFSNCEMKMPLWHHWRTPSGKLEMGENMRRILSVPCGGSYWSCRWGRALKIHRIILSISIFPDVRCMLKPIKANFRQIWAAQLDQLDVHLSDHFSIYCI